MTDRDKIFISLAIEAVRDKCLNHTTLTLGRLAKRHHELEKLVREKIREIDVALASNHRTLTLRHDALADEVHALHAALSRIAESVL